MTIIARLTAIVLVLAATGPLAACGDDGDDDAATDIEVVVDEVIEGCVQRDPVRLRRHLRRELRDERDVEDLFAAAGRVDVEVTDQEVIVDGDTATVTTTFEVTVDGETRTVERTWELEQEEDGTWVLTALPRCPSGDR